MELESYSKRLEEWSNKQLSDVEKSIRRTYREAVKEALGEIGNIYASYEKNGMLTYSEMVKFNRLEKFIESLIDHVNVLSQATQKTIEKLLKEDYEYSYYWMGWAFEKETSAIIGYRTLKLEKIEKALDNPVTGLTLSETLEKNRRDIIYKIRQNTIQSLVRGATYKEMANTLTDTFEGDYAKSIRVARTETHRVREAGSLDSAKYANSKGVITVKKWRNMKDSRVRRTSKANHVKMNDHKAIHVEDLFDLGNGEKGIAPGNTGYAHHDIHCRCILVYEIDRIDAKTNEDLAKQTFEDFKKAIKG